MPAPLATSRAALWVALLAIVTRLLYLVEHAGSAFFAVPILDEAYYDGLARALLGDGADPAIINPGFRPWGYPLVLAACHALADPFGRPLAVAVQHLGGVVTAIAVVWLAARMLRSAAGGAVAGTLYVLAGPPLFYEGELLITSFFTLAVVLVVTTLGRLGAESDDADALAGRGVVVGWLLAGALFALTFALRANALLFVPLVAVAAWVATPVGDRRMHGVLGRLAGFGVGALLVVLAFATFQQRITGRFGLMPSAGGVNLYLGNKRGADGMVPRQDWDVTYAEAYRDSVEVFAVEGFRRDHPGLEPTPSRLSRHWRGRAMDEITADPGAWLGLMARKASYLVWNREIPNNKRYSFVTREESPLLAAAPVRWWLLMALAPLGVVYAWHQGDRRRLFWLLAVAALHALGVVLFFVTARYRIPLWPLLTVLAAGGALALAEAARQRAWRRLGTGVVVAGLGALVALAPRSDASWPSLGRDHFFRSIAYLEKGDAEAAIADARASVRHQPDDGAAWLQLGNALSAEDQHAEALDAYRRAESLRAGEPRIANNIGVALEALGRPYEAYAAYRRALRQAAGYPPALVNAALLELRADQTAQADRRLVQAEAQGFDSIPLRAAQALVARARGDRARFEALIAPLRADHPDALARLLADQARPLDAMTLNAEEPSP